MEEEEPCKIKPALPLGYCVGSGDTKEHKGRLTQPEGQRYNERRKSTHLLGVARHRLLGGRILPAPLMTAFKIECIIDSFFENPQALGILGDWNCSRRGLSLLVLTGAAALTLILEPNTDPQGPAT